jgi:hypothetical protein
MKGDNKPKGVKIFSPIRIELRIDPLLGILSTSIMTTDIKSTFTFLPSSLPPNPQ